MPRVERCGAQGRPVVVTGRVIRESLWGEDGSRKGGPSWLCQQL